MSETAGLSGNRYSTMDWGNAINEHLQTSNPDRALEKCLGGLSLTRADRKKDFANLSLPPSARLEHHIEPLTNFLSRERLSLENMSTERFWLQIIPTGNTNDRRITVLDIPSEQIRARIEEVIEADKIIPDDYNLLICEFRENKYGGQMVVDESDRVFVFFGQGMEGDYSSGNKTPQYIADNASPTGIFHYSFDDPQLRDVIYRLATLIGFGTNSDSFRGNYRPGYYEFVLYEDSSGNLAPLIYDYSKDPLYKLPEEYGGLNEWS